MQKVQNLHWLKKNQNQVKSLDEKKIRNCKNNIFVGKSELIIWSERIFSHQTNVAKLQTRKKRKGRKIST